MGEYEKMLVTMQTVFCSQRQKQYPSSYYRASRANIEYISIADVRQNTEPGQNTARSSLDKIQTEQVRTRIQV